MAAHGGIKNLVKNSLQFQALFRCSRRSKLFVGQQLNAQIRGAPLILRNLNTSAYVSESFNIQDTEDFQKRVLESKVPVVVDFHATWCGPCKLLAPRLESVLEVYKGKLHFAKVDIDENADLALEYGVDAVPAVLGIKDGEVVERFIGLADEDKIKSFVDKTISS